MGARSHLRRPRAASPQGLTVAAPLRAVAADRVPAPPTARPQTCLAATLAFAPKPSENPKTLTSRDRLGRFSIARPDGAGTTASPWRKEQSPECWTRRSRLVRRASSRSRRRCSLSRESGRDAPSLLLASSGSLATVTTTLGRIDVLRTQIAKPHRVMPPERIRIYQHPGHPGLVRGERQHLESGIGDS